MAPAAKDTTSKKDDKKTRKDAAKSKDSVEKEPSVELTEEEQLEESRKAVEEMMGVSVYEALQHERQKQAEAGKRRASVSRFMYVGKLAEGSSDEDVLAQTKAVVADLDAAVEDSPWNHPTTVEDMAVTGLCLAHSNCVVGVFETKCPNALDFLTKLEKIPALDDKECRVLMCTEDCPSRNFVGNHFRKVSKKPDNFELSDDLDDVDVAWDLFQDVLKVHQICTRRNVPDPMDCGAADFIPSADRIRACADSGHKKPWFTLREFLEFFTDPIHIELESDKVWPTQRFEQVTGYLDDVNDDLTSKNPLPPGNEIGPEDIKN